MRIAVVNQHPSFALGGSEIQSDLIAVGLSSRGHVVRYVSPSTDGGSARAPAVPYEFIRSSVQGTSIARAIIEFNPDVVYWRYNRRALTRNHRMLMRRGIPFVFAASSIDDLRRWKSRGRIDASARGLWNTFSHRLEFRSLEQVTAVTVNSAALMSMAPHGPIVRHIPNGAIPSEDIFQWERPFVAWVSNFKRAKRPERFVDLAAELQDLDIDFLMAGRMRDNTYSWIKDPKRVPPNLRYLGEVTPSQAGGLLAAAVIHVHTCGPEGFPNVFIQAWIAGTPSLTLSYDPSGIMENVGLGASGGGDWSTFARLARQLLLNHEYRSRMGDLAKEYALAHFDLEKSLDRIESVLEEVTAIAE